MHPLRNLLVAFLKKRKVRTGDAPSPASHIRPVARRTLCPGFRCIPPLHPSGELLSGNEVRRVKNVASVHQCQQE